MPTNAELAKTVASLENGVAAILAAMQAQTVAPVAETPAEDVKPTNAAKTATSARKIVVPSERIEHEDGSSVSLAQVYASEANVKTGRKSIAFVTHGGFRVRMTSHKADGTQDGRYVNLTAAQLTAIRSLSDDAFNALVSDARS